MARDYKNAKRGGKSTSANAAFVWGLTLGLSVAAGVHFYHVNIAKQQKSLAADAEPATKSDQRTPASQKAETQQQFAFYDELPKYEVVVPEKDKTARRDAPDTRIAKPGTYMLQVGSYRNYADADRVRASLALQGIESKVVKVKIENDTWNRVRVGPIRDLKVLEDTQRKLREAQIDAIVIPVAD